MRLELMSGGGGPADSPEGSLAPACVLNRATAAPCRVQAAFLLHPAPYQVCKPGLARYR